MRRVNTEDVAGFINAYIVEAEFAKALGQPFAAGGLLRTEGRDAGQFHLPALEFGLGGAEPIACLLDFRERGQERDFFLGGRAEFDGSLGMRWHQTIGHLTTGWA